jgi:hypothetical protein
MECIPVTAETTSEAMTSAQIAAKISAAREHLASLDKKAKSLALPAVSGDGDAAGVLANTCGSIQRITADLAVLEAARLAAVRKEEEANAKADAERRERHMTEARAHAAEIVKLCRRADGLVEAFDALLVDLEKAERDAWSALREAGMRPNTGIVGSAGLARFVDARMLEVIHRRNKAIRHQKPVAEVAAVAWADLLSPEGAADE